MNKVSILLADDMEPMRDTMRRLILAMGFGSVTPVRHGEAAWEALNSAHFDLVLCDWNMPRLNGLGLLQRIRSTPGMEGLPFIMITGENSSEQVRSAMDAGATDLIVKPFTASLLEQRMRRALQGGASVPH